MSPKVVFLALPLLAMLLTCVDGRAASAKLDLAALRSVYPGAAIPMPAEIFPPAYRQKLLADKQTYITNGNYRAR